MKGRQVTKQKIQPIFKLAIVVGLYLFSIIEPLKGFDVSGEKSTSNRGQPHIIIADIIVNGLRERVWHEQHA